MKTKTKHVAIDGRKFDHMNECIDYEQLIKRVDNIMSVLPKKPDSCDFGNGGGYIQHEELILRSVQVSILELCKKHIDHDWIQQSIDDATVHPSYVGRLLDDYGIAPLSKAWFRFMCIDSQSREWGQPYYALNPTKGNQIEL